MPEIRLPGVPAAVLLPISGFVLLFWLGDPAVGLVVSAVFAAAHLVTIPDRAGRPLSLSAMVALAALLVTDGALVDLVAGAAVGMPLGWGIVRIRAGPRGLDHLVPAEPVALVGTLVVFELAHALVVALGSGGKPGNLGHAVVVGAAAVTWYVVAATVRSAGPVHRRLPARILLREALRDGPAYAALFAGGALFGLGWPVMRWWAIPLALMPYAFSHLSLLRVAITRRTYRQTITALGRIPEAGGQVGQGRASRTSELAASVAAQLGMGPEEIERVESAGLLHEVGRVVFNDPAVSAGGYSDADVAAWGAAIIREAPILEPVALIVADQARPYRRPGQARDETVPRTAQVVRVAAAYDRAVHESGTAPVDALEALYRGAAYDYDPEVVAALRMVLRRRGVHGV